MKKEIQRYAHCQFFWLMQWFVHRYPLRSGNVWIRSQQGDRRNTSDLKDFQSSQADEFGTDTGSDAELFGSDDAKQEFQDGENSEEGTDGIRYIKGRPLTEEERKEELEPFKNLKPLDPGIEVESDLTSVYAAYGNRELHFHLPMMPERKD